MVNIDLSNWKQIAMYFGILVGAGVITGIAVVLVTKTIEAHAQLAAKAEMQKLLLVAASSQRTNPPTYSESAQTAQMM